jgi:hypothetical protein
MVSRNLVHEALVKHVPELSAEHHRRVLDGLQAAGIIDGQGGVIRAVADTAARHLLSPRMAASAARSDEAVRALKNVAARCARAGYPIDFNSDEPISLHKLDAAFKACGRADSTETMSIKGLMAALGLIA